MRKTCVTNNNNMNGNLLSAVVSTTRARLKVHYGSYIMPLRISRINSKHFTASVVAKRSKRAQFSLAKSSKKGG